MKRDLARSLLADLLPRCLLPARRLGLERPWRALRRVYEAGRLPVSARVHGRRLWMNPGNPYPFTVAEHPRFNHGLVATVEALRAELRRPLRVIDVGAAIGDTPALIDTWCPEHVGEWLCIDGDEEFALYFRLNTARIARVAHVRAMLAAREGSVPSLVRNTPATATAAGPGSVPATTLDRVLDGTAPGWDLLKIDIDGYDGEALLGGRDLVRRESPAVYFEWHPRLARQAGNDALAPFATLAEAGYSDFLWFSNRGPFSHFSGPPGADALAREADLLARDADRQDHHYDILALPPRWARLALPIALRVGR